jgi:hypothetical protein
MNNFDESSQMMLHMIDTDAEKRQILPTIPTTEELTSFRVSSERHGAYELMWKAISFAGVLGNTAMWLYF